MPTSDHVTRNKVGESNTWGIKRKLQPLIVPNVSKGVKWAGRYLYICIVVCLLQARANNKNQVPTSDHVTRNKVGESNTWGITRKLHPLLVPNVTKVVKWTG